MSDNSKIKQYSSPEEIILKAGVYEKFYMNIDEDTKKLAEFVFFDGAIDTYCIGCKQSSIFQFQPERHPVYGDKLVEFRQRSGRDTFFINGSVIHLAYCSRNKEHVITFCFLFQKNILMKIGQYPSIADLEAPDMKKYEKVLGDNNFSDLRRAVRLKSHGIGAGSLVYLRRVFENLIEEAHNIAKTGEEWDENSYQRGKMVDKIQILAPYLPETLMELKGIYGIMSKGIHSLSEEECIIYFEPVRLGIELILQEKLTALQKKEEKKKSQEIIDSLSQITSQLGDAS